VNPGFYEQIEVARVPPGRPSHTTVAIGKVRAACAQSFVLW